MGDRTANNILKCGNLSDMTTRPFSNKGSCSSLDLNITSTSTGDISGVRITCSWLLSKCLLFWELHFVL